MRIGIIGLPATGKTTLFNLLCQAGGSHIGHQSPKEPNVTVVKLPDRRMEYLASLFHPKKLTYATTEFVDFVSLTRGAGTGEGLGSHYLSQMRQAKTEQAHIASSVNTWDICFHAVVDHHLPDGI